VSEHIQSTPAPHAPAPAPAEEHEHTPGVAREREWFDFWLIFKVGAGLAITALIIQVLVWWLLGGLERVNTQPTGVESALAIEDAARPFGQRVDNVPPPHLEGIERESSLVIVRTEQDELKRFYASTVVHVRIGDNDKANLFALREGQRVTLSYYMPNGVGGGMGVVAALASPAGRAENAKTKAELPDTVRTLNATLIKIEPRSIAAARAWAEAQKDKYGWIDRKQEIVHIPIDQAIDSVLESKEFRPAKGKIKDGGRFALPTRSSSGRSTAGGQP
jgi:hypothetical protein